MFGQVPRVLWQERLHPDRRNRIPLTVNCVLIQSPQGNILVDSGIGVKRRDLVKERFAGVAGRLLRGLRSHDLSPRDINYVILSHLHFDHAGGCTKLDRNGDAVPTFPKAKYLVQRAAWEGALNPNERSRPSFFLDDFTSLGQRGQLALLDGDCEVVPGVQAKLTGGHTPGHQVVIINQGGERVAYFADLIPTSHHLSLPWIGAIDTHPEEVLERKRALLQEAEKDGWLIIFSHDVEHQAGYLERRSGKLRLRPVNL